MIKKESVFARRILLGLFLIVFFGNFVLAEIELGNKSYDIETVYGVGGKIKGWINISFKDLEADSNLSDSFGNSISIKDLIDLNNLDESDYSCSTLGCRPTYNKINPLGAFTLDNGESRLIGLELLNYNSLERVNFSLHSNAGPNCFSQIKLDYGNDGYMGEGEGHDFANTKASSTRCEALKTYGCFDKTKPTVENYLSSPYCQKMKFRKAPKFEVGAYVTKISGKRNFTMSVRDSEGIIGSCNLPPGTGDVPDEYYCVVDVEVIRETEYAVCIEPDLNMEGEYSLKGYEIVDGGCGVESDNFNNQLKDAAYQIYAMGKQFDSIGEIKMGGDEMANALHEELLERHELNSDGAKIDCPDSKCILLIRIDSFYDNQEISIDNMDILFKSSTGINPANQFYNLEEIKSQISSKDFLQLSLDEANFLVPEDDGDDKFVLELNGEELVDEEIKIEEVPILGSISPSTTAYSYPTEFVIEDESDFNLVKFTWDFGNGEIRETETNKITYTYNRSGTYDLSVSVEDSNGRKSEKTYQITVESPGKIINNSIKTAKENLERVMMQIDSIQSKFERDNLKRLVNIKVEGDRTQDETIDEVLEQIERNYALKQKDLDREYDEDIELLLKEALKLDFPKSIETVEIVDSITYYPKKENINMNLVSAIENEEFKDDEDEELYQNSILIWQNKNIEVKVSLKKYQARYKTEQKSINFVKVVLRPEEDIDESYLVMENFEDLLFAGDDYDEDPIEGYEEYYQIEIEGDKTIEFLTTEEITIHDLDLFVTPLIDDLILPVSSCGICPEDRPICKKGVCVERTTKNKWGWFIVIIVFLFFLGLSLYILLQVWYQRKYEGYLFKNRTDLYNIVKYIQNSKKKGLSDSEIKSKLKKAGWSGEQVTYVSRKYLGKKTGVPFEIPINSFLDLFSKEKEGPKERPKMPPRWVRAPGRRV